MKRVVPLAALLAAGVFTSAAQAHQPSVPAEIAVPAGHQAYLTAHAVGVQIYSCGATGWTLVAPRADLYDHGKKIGTHFAGPTWQAKDGSAVVGHRVNGVTVDPTAIPWLLLDAASTTVGDDGDRLAGTTYIQRVATTGGLPPAASDCNAATERVPNASGLLLQHVPELVPQ